MLGGYMFKYSRETIERNILNRQQEVLAGKKIALTSFIMLKAWISIERAYGVVGSLSQIFQLMVGANKMNQENCDIIFEAENNATKLNPQKWAAMVDGIILMNKYRIFTADNLREICKDDQYENIPTLWQAFSSLDKKRTDDFPLEERQQLFIQLIQVDSSIQPQPSKNF
jgi:hypothetical protein